MFYERVFYTLSGASVSDIPSSVLGSSIRSKDCNLEYEEKGVTVPDEGIEPWSSRYMLIEQSPFNY